MGEGAQGDGSGTALAEVRSWEPDSPFGGVKVKSTAAVDRLQGNAKNSLCPDRGANSESAYSGGWAVGIWQAGQCGTWRPGNRCGK